MAAASVLSYYQQNRFNPVLIPVEQESVWASHRAKRRNLYERHLRIPLSLLKGRRVLEFGPSSGENALVLALHGARLTLVEPNEQVFPRLYDLFDKFGMRKQLDGIVRAGIGDFQSDELYDFVIAEGFLYTIPERDALLQRMTRLIAPGMFGVVSSNDFHGGLMELLRRAILYRACRLAGIADEHSAEGLTLARRLFLADFGKLNTSRTFDAWWKDNLVNPFYVTECLWSFPTLFRILDEANCAVHGCSPDWMTADHHEWYKNVPSRAVRGERIARNWKENFCYVLTGQKPSRYRQHAADDGVVEAVGWLAGALSDIGRSPRDPDRAPEYPRALDWFLSEQDDPQARQVNVELKALIAALGAADLEELVRAHAESGTLRSLWGTPYHYLSFIRER
ncbi:MAG TPA: methyltransferase domain-containing protein [Urbifossiella sp.]|nr:methyltransferase domain-containing protein [Urbifossiella sp.]